MGYTALLFCPDEKTARTVTQVLSELDFSVEACGEPFAAVNKLMGKHFDAVVVDCDNEQNATLLFKSARNSTSNQTSLAVAVVEGQAGVAKAFRIGANLVLTKPINIEQSKGTLRVARGLLRKSDPAKGAAPAVAAGASTSGPGKAAVPKPTATPMASPLVSEPVPAPVAKSTPAWPAAAVASTKPSAQDDDLLDIDGEPAKGTPAATVSSQGMTSSGAASAPAPAREHTEPAVEKKPEDILPVAVPDKPAGAAEAVPAGMVGSAPTFGFDEADADAESGGRKKIIFGAAAAVIIAAGLYGGWAHFHGAADQPAPTESSSSSTVPTNVSQPAPSPTKPQPPPGKPTAAPSSPISGPVSNKVQNIIDETSKEDEPASASVSTKSSDTTTTTKPETAPLIVKGGKVSTRAKASADAPAPSMIGLAAPGASTPPPSLVSSTASSVRPTLQTVNVSQGVSTGLLIKKVPPTYPSNALRLRIEGTVELQATISKTGEITHIKLVSGDSQLTKAATDAVKQWKYKPYLLNGEPVEMQTQVTINFRLPH